MADFCKCGSIKNLGHCTNMRCPEKNHKLISWIIDGIEYRFKEWVTKDEAEEAVQNESIIVVRSKGNPYIQRAIIN